MIALAEINTQHPAYASSNPVQVWPVGNRRAFQRCQRVLRLEQPYYNTATFTYLAFNTPLNLSNGLQVYDNMLGDMDFFSDPAAALANAVVKTNDQLHRAVRSPAPRSLPHARHEAYAGNVSIHTLLTPEVKRWFDLALRCCCC